MFIQVIGKGYINVNNIVMVSSKNVDGKYCVTLAHGGKIIVGRSVRDKIIKGDEITLDEPRSSGKKSTVSFISVDDVYSEVKSDE